MNEIINKGYSKLLSTVIYFNCQQEIWQVSPFLQIEVRSSLYEYYLPVSFSKLLMKKLQSSIM